MKLHPSIASHVVDVMASPYLAPLPVLEEIRDRRLIGERWERWEQGPDPALVASKVERVLGLAGSVRGRKRAAATAVELHASFAFQFQLPPPTALDLLRVTLGVRPSSTGVHPANGWLTRGDEIAADRVALQVIADVVATKRAAIHARRTIYWLLDWHLKEHLVAPVVAINALAFVVGLVQPDGQPDRRVMGRVVGSDWRPFRRNAVKDANDLVLKGVVTPTDDTAPGARELRRMRGNDHYQQVMRAHYLGATTEERQAESRAATQMHFAQAAPRIWAKFHQGGGGRLADFRRTYWRMRRDKHQRS